MPDPGDRLHRQGLRVPAGRRCCGLARQRLPEWTDRSPADLGMVLIDLFAYVGDIVAYYQDRIASELFPGTATERRQRGRPAAPGRLRAHARRAGPGRSAAHLPASDRTADRDRAARRPVHRPAEAGRRPGRVHLSGPDLDHRRCSPIRCAGHDADGARWCSTTRLPVEQSRAVGPVVIGSSTGEPNQTSRCPSPTVDRRLGGDRGRRRRRLGDLGPPRQPVVRHRARRAAVSPTRRPATTSSWSTPPTPATWCSARGGCHRPASTTSGRATASAEARSATSRSARSPTALAAVSALRSVVNPAAPSAAATRSASSTPRGTPRSPSARRSAR